MMITPRSLTPRQHEIMLYTATGMTADQIGRKLFISPDTVTRHRADAYIRLGVLAGAPEAIALLMITCLDFYNEAKQLILSGECRPNEHSRGGIQPGGFQ